MAQHTTPAIMRYSMVNVAIGVTAQASGNGFRRAHNVVDNPWLPRHLRARGEQLGHRVTGTSNDGADTAEADCGLSLGVSLDLERPCHHQAASPIPANASHPRC